MHSTLHSVLIRYVMVDYFLIIMHQTVCLMFQDSNCRFVFAFFSVYRFRRDSLTFDYCYVSNY